MEATMETISQKVKMAYANNLAEWYLLKVKRAREIKKIKLAISLITAFLLMAYCKM